MNDLKRKESIEQFINDWKDCGDEKSDAQKFWLALLRDVCGQERPEKIIDFESRVKDETTSFIDGYIAKTKVLIEHKSYGTDLDKKEIQSDSQKLTPYQQAKRYVANLERSKHPNWIVISNFNEFRIYDTEHPNDDPAVVFLEDLKRDYKRFDFLFDSKIEKIPTSEDILSVGAGEIIGSLYKTLMKQYGEDISEADIRALNILCVRLVFCLYAEDAGLFEKNAFHDYLISFNTANINEGLSRLFRILNTKTENIGRFDKERFKNFDYVNGGLFEEEIDIPPFDEESKYLLIVEASENFDWEDISPSIFGTIFESTLDPKTRQNNGMHYTSIENIEKVIYPLYMDALNQEFDEVLKKPIRGGVRTKALEDLHDKLSKITILDPACGSGNFLTVSYMALRRLENRIITEQHKEFKSGQVTFAEFGISSADEFLNNYADIRVSIKQFYGIEINEFASEVARTAMWIAESQMFSETFKGLNLSSRFLPLKAYENNIICANALRTEWNDLISANELHYIISNPPFIGKNDIKGEQKNDVDLVIKSWNQYRKLDYVACWYKKSLEMMKINKKIKTALVSTNSITQGEQVAYLWKPLLSEQVCINFAYKTFRWESDATDKAHVHCVIIGFSLVNTGERYLYGEEGMERVSHISPYLTTLDDNIVEAISQPICDVPETSNGSMPNDDKGKLSKYTEDEKDAIIQKYPVAEKMFRQFIGAEEYLSNKKRYCLWLVDVPSSDIMKVPPVLDAIKAVKKKRNDSSRAETNLKAETPYLFGEIRQPDSDYIIIPRHTLEKRKYTPFAVISKDIICGDANDFIPNASYYMLGVLQSSVHLFWIKYYCGRLETRLRYSIDLLYNTFPFPDVSDKQREIISSTAKRILDVRNNYPSETLKALYDTDLMKPDLLAAHKANDKAVMDAYGFDSNMSEEEIVVALYKMYEINLEKRNRGV